MKKFVAIAASAVFGLGALAGCSNADTSNSDGAKADQGAPAQEASSEAYTAEELNAILSKVNGANGPLEPAKPGEDPAVSPDQLRQMAEQMEISPAECRDAAKTALGGGGSDIAEIPTSTAADMSGEGASMSINSVTLMDGSPESVKKAGDAATGGTVFQEKSDIEKNLGNCGTITIGPAGQGMKVTTELVEADVKDADESYATKTSMVVAGQNRVQHTVQAHRGSLIVVASGSDLAESQRMAGEALAQAK